MPFYSYFKPYVPVAKRIANAKKQIAKLENNGRTCSPIKIEGRKISTTFWGNAWCENLEAYSDFQSRLPRGRTYVRNGSVVDLQISPGTITALVAGSELYEIEIAIKTLPAPAWKSISDRCAGQIASVLELLSGKLSTAVMEIITHPDTGLFPKPKEIDMTCSCPDGAYMCKHIAAVLYGIGNRLDSAPELLFLLRNVNHLDLLSAAATLTTITDNASPSSSQTLEESDLSDVFGISLDSPTPAPTPESPRHATTPSPTPAKPAKPRPKPSPKSRAAKQRKARRTPSRKSPRR